MFDEGDLAVAFGAEAERHAPFYRYSVMKLGEFWYWFNSLTIIYARYAKTLIELQVWGWAHITFHALALFPCPRGLIEPHEFFSVFIPTPEVPDRLSLVQLEVFPFAIFINTKRSTCLVVSLLYSDSGPLQRPPSSPWVKPPKAPKYT